MQGWHFQGIFETEDKAVEACRDWSYFMAEVNLNESLPHENLGDWPGWRRPRYSAAS